MLEYGLMNRHFRSNTALRMFCYCMTTALVVATSGRSAQEENASNENRDAAYNKMELLTEAILHIKKNYVEEKTYEQIISWSQRLSRIYKRIQEANTAVSVYMLE